MFEVELFRDKRKKWRSRVKAGNNKIIWSSEAYSSHLKCKHTVVKFCQFVKWKISFRYEK